MKHSTYDTNRCIFSFWHLTMIRLESIIGFSKNRLAELRFFTNQRGDSTDWLQEFRIKKGFSQEQVATRSGISRPAYSNIENGNRRPSPQVAQKIGKVLDFQWTMFYENISSNAEEV